MVKYIHIFSTILILNTATTKTRRMAREYSAVLAGIPGNQEKWRSPSVCSSILSIYVLQVYLIM